MEIQASVPESVSAGQEWSASVQSHAAESQFSLHYHPVEEWLQVQEGSITFVSAGGRELVINPGMVLKIPQGELHSVRVGTEGVTYQMWLGTQPGGQPFRQEVDEDLIRKNLQIPEVENGGPSQALSTFFRELLSPDVLFRAVPGNYFRGIDAFLARPAPAIVREASDAVRVLDQTDEAVLLSTVVHTTPSGGGAAKSVTNDRLFVRENDAWKCRYWLNSPVP